VLMPWAPTEGLPPRQQEREARAALADTSRLVVDSVPGGYVRTLRFAFQEVGVSELIVAPADRGGTYLRVDSAMGDAFLWEEPAMRIRQAKGELSLREGVMRYQAPELVLPNSRLSSLGVVDITGDEPAYDVGITAERMSLRDMQWLNPAFPDEGTGSFKMWMETRPEGLLFLARDMRINAPGTRVQGSFGMVLGDTLRFVEANLTASPLNLQMVERLIPGGLPVSGLRIGGVEVRPAGRS